MTMPPVHGPPLCPQCGAEMHKTGDCFTCSACGNWEPLVDEGTPEPRKFGHLGVAIVGGYIWPGWSRSREIFLINP